LLPEREANRVWSLTPIDIPKNEVPFEQRRLPDIKYLDTGKPEWMDMKPVLDVINEALKAAGKN
jgi:hypothetical protein